MQVFEGTFKPPAADPLNSLLPIGGKGRCTISEEGMVFEGFKAGLPLGAVLIALAAALLVGGGGYVLTELGIMDLDLQEIFGAAVLSLMASGAFFGLKVRKTRPLRYEVALDGVKSVEPAGEGLETLRFKLPGIKRKAALYFKPDQGPDALIQAFEQIKK
jgi:hypothetical protein